MGLQASLTSRGESNLAAGNEVAVIESVIHDLNAKVNVIKERLVCIEGVIFQPKPEKPTPDKALIPNTLEATLGRLWGDLDGIDVRLSDINAILQAQLGGINLV